MGGLPLLLLAFAASAAAAPSSSRDPLAEKAYAAHEAGKREEALALLRAGLRKRPDALALHRAYLTLTDNYGMLELVAEEYEARRASAPGGFNSYLAAAAQPTGASARRVVEAALRRGESHPLLTWARDAFRAGALASAGKDKAARELLERSGGAALEPAVYELLNASLLLRRGDFEEAKAAVARARAADRLDGRVLQAAAFLELGDGDVWGFSAALDEAARHGDGAWLHAARATERMLYGRLDESRREAEEALRQPQDRVDWVCARVSALQTLGALEEAARLGREAEAADSTLSCGRPAVVFSHLAAGRLEEAEKAAKAAYDRDPRDINHQVAWAGVLSHLGRNIDAHDVWKQALRQNPRNPVLLVEAGAAIAREGDCSGAELRYFIPAYNTANDFPSVNRESGDCALQQRRFSDALRHYAALLRTGENDLSAWWGLASAHRGLGRLDEAEKGYGEALKHAAPGVDMARLVAEIAELKRALKERDARLTGDAKAATLALKRVKALQGRPAASYSRHGFEVGVPWEQKPLLVVPHGYQTNMGRRWSPDGSALYWPTHGGIIKTELGRPATGWLLRDARLPDGGRSWVDGVFVSPDSRRVYALWIDAASGRESVYRLDSLDLATGRSRTLHTSLSRPRLWQDGALDRLYFMGGSNWSLDPVSGARAELPRLGCTLDLDMDKGARRVACVAATKGVGAQEAELAIVDTATGRKQYLKAAGISPRWSPDGKRLAYFWRGRQLRLYEPDTGRIVALDPGLVQDPSYGRPESEDGGQLEWSPDSRFVFYQLDGVLDRGEAPPEHAYADRRRSVIADLERREAWVSDEGFFDFEWAPRPADALPLPPPKR